LDFARMFLAHERVMVDWNYWQHASAANHRGGNVDKIKVGVLPLLALEGHPDGVKGAGVRQFERQCRPDFAAADHGHVVRVVVAQPARHRLVAARRLWRGEKDHVL
ncbi:MAG: hypothetical protein ACK55Z_00435, partial [bacterium]